jgi:hypothetical protein
MYFPNSRFLLGFCKGESTRKAAFIGLVLAVFLFMSCTAYHPMPITSGAVDTKLQPPGMDKLRVLAGKIKRSIALILASSPPASFSHIGM